MQNDTKEALQRMSEELLAQEAPSAPEEITDPEILLYAPEEALLSALDESSAEEENESEFPETPAGFTDETLILPDMTAQEPAFDDPQIIHEPDEPMIYWNFSNGYGRDLPQQQEVEAEEPASISKSDKIDIGLMLAASGLCLGIIAILIYWLAAYL